MFDFFQRRPITTICLLLMLVCLSLYGLGRLDLGGTSVGDRAAFEVTIEHFGIDSEEIERSITRPLEEAMAGLQGIAELRSVSEYGSSRLTITCLPGVLPADFYLDLREVVDRVYRELPTSVQKPRVHSSDSRMSPVFIMSIETQSMGTQEFHDWVEREIKPSFEREQGVGEVEIGGGQLREVQILVDTQRARLAGLSSAGIAQTLRSQDCLLPAGRLFGSGTESILVVDGHLGHLEDLRRLPLLNDQGKTGAVLQDLAQVSYGEREGQRLSRLDGERKLLLYVHPAGSVNPIRLSQTLRQKADALMDQGLKVEVVLDTGKEMENALLQTIWAMIEGIAVIILVLPLFLPRIRQLIGMAIMIPLALLGSLALFTAAGISIDPNILAGIAIGLGSILDTCILVAEQPDLGSFKRLVPTMGASLLTVLVVLLPLMILGSLEASLKDMAMAIVIILVVTFAFSVIFLPTLAGIGKERSHHDPPVQPGIFGIFDNIRTWCSQRFGRRSLRFFTGLVLFCARYPKYVFIFAGIFCAVAGGMAMARGMDLASGTNQSAISVHVEFPPEATLESIDRRMGDFATIVRTIPGITRVESLSRLGSAEMTVIHDSTTKRETLSDLIRAKGQAMAGTFVYLPEGTSNQELIFELAILGDDNQTLRALAHDAAAALQSQAWVKQVVLNFKEAPPELALQIDRKRAAAFGLSVAEIQSTARWNLWGPVALKWLDGMRERDLRVMDQQSRTMSRSRLMSLPAVGTAANTVALGSVAQLVEQPGSPKIYRKNRQRAVYLTVHAQNLPLEKTEALLKGALRQVNLPTSYAYELDRHLRESQENSQRLLLFMGASLVFIYMVFAFQTQSWGAPLLVLSIVPVALAFPVFFNALSGNGISIPILLGCIILAGVVVNNSILVVDGVLTPSRRDRSRRNGIRLAFRAVRSRISPLMVTATATLVGCFPLLFAATATTSFMTALSFVILWGVVGGLVATILILPACMALFPQALTTYAFHSRNPRQEQS